MTDPQHTFLVLFVDRSSSMKDLADEATSSIKHLIAQQQSEPGSLTINLFEFSDQLAEVPLTDIHDWTLQPHGMTALNDALGTTIKIVGNRLAGYPEDERPGKVIFQITTDGHENASQEYTGPMVAQMIK